MLTKSLYLSSIRFLTKNIWQFASLITGIVLSVAIITATDLAIESAKKSFELSTEIINGKATHHIINNGGKIDEELVVNLENKYKLTVTPLIEGFVTKNNRLLKVIGIDPFSDIAFRSIFKEFNSRKQYNPSAFINKLEGFFTTKHTAEKFRILPGDPLLIDQNDETYRLKLYGLIDSDNAPASASLDNLLFMDISTAQELLKLQNYISRIDLILKPEEENELKNILFAIDPSLVLIKSSERNQAQESMTKSFNANLSALSLLAMLVGIFLIYNTMTFAVLQRRKIFGFLRTIGVSQKEIFSLIIFESLLFAIIGSLIGIGLGYLLANVLLSFIVRTINDLYFVLQVSQIHISNITFLKAGLIGVFAALLSALIPAYEASNSPVTKVIKNIDIEEKVKKYLPKLNIAGLVLISLSLLLFLIFEKNISACFFGLFIMVIGFSCFIPFLTYHSDYILEPLYRNTFGLASLISLRSLKKNLSRNAIAIAALTVAISLYLSLDIAINSFRNTVEDWLSASLFADIYISTPKQVSHRNHLTLNNKVIEFTKTFQTEDIIGISEYHLRDVIGEYGSTRVASINSLPIVKNSFTFKESTKDIWSKFDKGEGLIASAPYAYKHKIKCNDKVKLQTDKGLQTFTILGIFSDYSSDQGLLMMHQDLYRSLWEDPNLSSLGIFLKESTETELEKPKKNKIHLLTNQKSSPKLDKIKTYIEAYKTEAAKESLSPTFFDIRSNKELLKESLEIFDRTFRVTSALKIIAVIVAAFGIFSALLSLIIEREKEFALLKALGMSKQDIQRSISLQAFTMGLLSSIFAIPLGIASAWVMIFVINHRSFGWDINFSLDFKSILFATLISVTAALIAAIFPSQTQSKVSPRELEKDEAF
ncbi:MAG: FtsX-like permease family protein [Proteobacteria bacterium]|nr:FtsX-like permease family protein [Pseudomonadota bacterium]